MVLPLSFEEKRRLRLQRERFARARKAETWYGAQLRKLAQQVGLLASVFDPDDPLSLNRFIEALRSYSHIISPWAHNIATRMLEDVSKRDAQAWREHTREMGLALRTEIASTPTGELMRQLLNEQVTLITSLPLDAAQRVHKIALEAITEAQRPKALADMILESGHVSKSRATLIARTETARVQSLLTQARAEHIGSEGYIWRSVMDADTRPEIGIKRFSQLNTLEMGSHRKLNGTFHKWSEPPIASANGTRAHAGQIYNCRCWADPVLPAQLQAA